MKIASPEQLSLGVSLLDEATFANFYAHSGKNAQPLAALTSLAHATEARQAIVWGAPGVGASHLLQAVCHEAVAAGRTIQYLPLTELVGFSAQDICDGLENIHVVCLDDIDQICGNRSWEQAIFHLFNNLRDAGHCMVFSSHTSPPSLPILLPDLKSRVLSCEFHHVKAMTDDEKAAAMILRASVRGMELSMDVARYILNRGTRDSAALFDYLDRLDDASLRQQRKLTIPFVKTVLGF